MRAKSSFEKRRYRFVMINKNSFIFHFSIWFFFILNYVPPFFLSIFNCGQILKGLAMFSWQGFSVFYRIHSRKQSAAQLAFQSSSHSFHFCQHDLTTWQASLPQMNSPMTAKYGVLVFVIRFDDWNASPLVWPLSRLWCIQPYQWVQ
jgi:hypothetical protein